MANLSLKYRNLPKIPKNIKTFFREKDIQNFFLAKAADVIAHSDKNLDKGQDVDGSGMRQYSSSYKKVLTKAGESTKTDLLRTGELRNSRHSSRIPNGARIEFSPGRSGKKPASGRGVGNQQGRSPRGSRASRGAGRGLKKSQRTSRPTRLSGGGSAISNVKLAEVLMNKGFENWHAISEKDNDRITKEFSDLVQKKFVQYLKTNAINSN